MEPRGVLLMQVAFDPLDGSSIIAANFAVGAGLNPKP